MRATYTAYIIFNIVAIFVPLPLELCCLCLFWQWADVLVWCQHHGAHRVETLPLSLHFMSVVVRFPSFTQCSKNLVEPVPWTFVSGETDKDFALRRVHHRLCPRTLRICHLHLREAKLLIQWPWTISFHSYLCSSSAIMLPYSIPGCMSWTAERHL